MVHIEGVGLRDIAEGSIACAPTKNGENQAIDHEERNSTMSEGPSLTQKTTINAGNTDNNVSSSGGLPDWLNNILPRISHHMKHGLEVVAPSTHGACPVEELLQMKSEKTTEKVLEEGESAYTLYEHVFDVDADFEIVFLIPVLSEVCMHVWLIIMGLISMSCIL